jgi:hypothetical protein
MAESVQETKPPEPPPKPREVPKPIEPLHRDDAENRKRPQETQETAREEARDAAQSEYAKAVAAREPDGVSLTSELRKPAENTSEKAPENASESADDDSLAVSRPGREQGQSPETAERLQKLRDEGHGPQRHHDTTETHLKARLGTPLIPPWMV